MNKIAWRARRLAAMGPAEVIHRVREAVRRSTWRGYAGGWAGFGPGHGVYVQVPDVLRTRLQGPRPGGVAERMSASARTANSRRFLFLGTAWPPTDPAGTIPWLLDPVSGERWEGAERYCFDVDHRHAPGRGDVKLVWELNRLQFLPWVAAEDPAAAWTMLSTWMEENPPFRGVNWNSGIELSMRLVSLALALAAAADDPPAPVAQDMARFVAAHAFWLARYPSLHSSANNHLIAEGIGLFVAATLLPGHRDAAEWERHGRSILENETLRQFFADGVGAEQSPTYTAFSAEMVALGALLAGGVGKPLASHVGERLARVAVWLRTMMDCTGRLPRIGDDDEGRVIAMPPDREPRYVASVVAALAGLLGRPDLLPPDRDPHVRDVIFAAPAGRGTLQAGLTVFPEGGYSVVREGEGTGRECLLVFDHGPLGYLSIAAHGHADTLAFWLHCDGEPLIVDAGTYLYHAAGPWRGAFCGTASHNTLRLGVDSSTQVGPFLWSHKARGRLLESRGGPDWRLCGSHDGYRSRYGVDHVRAIEREKGAIVITDRLDGQRRPEEATIAFLFHPLCSVNAESGGFTVRRGEREVLRLEPDPAVSCELASGDEVTRRGWYSAAFGERQPTVQLLCRATLSPGSSIRTVLRIMQPDGDDAVDFRERHVA